MYSMNVHAKHGDKLTVSEQSINFGYPPDVMFAKKHLKINNVYTIDYTKLVNTSLKIKLIEFPDHFFNASCFIDFN